MFLMLLLSALFGGLLMVGHVLVRAGDGHNNRSLWLIWLGNAMAWPTLLFTAIEAGGENNLQAGLWVMGMCALGAWGAHLAPTSRINQVFHKLAFSFIPLFCLLSWAILHLHI